MSAALALMRTEMTLLFRNTTAWSTGVAMPLLFGTMWVRNPPRLGQGWGAVVVLQVVMLLVFTLHTVGVMTLATRREQLVLKRWRLSQAGSASVLAGTIAPLAALVALQAAALTSITVIASGQAPASVTMLAIGVLAGVALVGALTFAVAAITRAAEHAMITTVPVIGVLAGASLWALTRPFDALDWPVLALPGGAVAQVLRLGWRGLGATGGGLAAWAAEAAPSLAASVLLTAIATVAAIRCFRWEPRN